MGTFPSQQQLLWLSNCGAQRGFCCLLMLKVLQRMRRRIMDFLL
ncbi:hypothetical protein FQN60_010291 [Etheostoma spectabile]|uniref:Uncharacterized protein n=1 Tax=Etheostoma spectabile TaxID=54343 RepID=A0A5J5D8J9_9PERO|nr:hypothetical protein FQN60_010291 [Etheostoma spectabile]